MQRAARCATLMQTQLGPKKCQHSRRAGSCCNCHPSQAAVVQTSFGVLLQLPTLGPGCTTSSTAAAHLPSSLQPCIQCPGTWFPAGTAARRRTTCLQHLGPCSVPPGSTNPATALAASHSCLTTAAACISHMSLHALLVCIAVIHVAPIAVVRIPGPSAAAAVIHLKSLSQPASQQPMSQRPAAWLPTPDPSPHLPRGEHGAEAERRPAA